MPDFIPRITIHPDKICLYNEVKWNGPRTSRKIQFQNSEDQSLNQSAFLESTRRNNGYLSVNARRKLFKSIDYLLLTSPQKKVYSIVQQKYISFRIVFVTLTLPSKQIHSDKEITNKCFNQLLIELTKYHNVKSYVWRAEKQENGNIHYHLLINEFIEWSVLRKRWNRITNKLGYVDVYQAKMKEYFKNGFRISNNPNDKRTVKEQRKAYLLGQKSDWRSPNSTDIHDTRKIRDIKNYVGKYMTKQPDINLLKQCNNPLIDKTALNDYTVIDLERMSKDSRLNLDAIIAELDKYTVKSRLWSSSHNLADVKGCQLIEDWEISDELHKITSTDQLHLFSGNYFKVLFVNYTDLIRLGSVLLFKYFSDYIIQTFNYHLPINLSL